MGDRLATIGRFNAILAMLFNRSLAEGSVPLDWKLANVWPIFSERELMITFAICCRPSVCLSVCLSVTFVRPTQAVQIFGNIATVLGTFAIH